MNLDFGSEPQKVFERSRIGFFAGFGVWLSIGLLDFGCQAVY
jgi:hypothetical protein